MDNTNISITKINLHLEMARQTQLNILLLDPEFHEKLCLISSETTLSPLVGWVI